MPATCLSILKPADAPALEAFLRPRLATSMFLVSNVRKAGLIDRGERYHGTYAAAWSGGRIEAVAGHFWNGILILQAPCRLEEVVRTALTSSGRPLTGIIGPADQVAGALRVIGGDNVNIRIDEQEILYTLDLAALNVPEPLASAELVGRRARRDDAELLAAWNADYSVEALGEEDTPELRRAHQAGIDGMIAERRTWVLEDAGRPVAMCSFNAQISEAVQVGGVWTPPELRSRGYGRSVVAAALRDARQDGVQQAILFTGVENIPAQKAYEALGFRPEDSFRVLLLAEPVNVNQ